MSRAWTWRHAVLESGLPATTKHVLLVISCHMNDIGEGCYPSTRTLADKCSLSERSVCTHIEEAEKAGWLKVQKHGFAGQKWARHEYSPDWPKGTENDAEPVKGTERQNRKALNLAQEGTEPDAAYIDNIPANIPSKPSKGGEEEFNVFWSAYPRKAGKPNALRAWKRRKPDLETVLAALKRWKASDQWTKDQGQYIPYPATWLNDERWNDAIAGEKPVVSPEELEAQRRKAEAGRSLYEESIRRGQEERLRQMGITA